MVDGCCKSTAMVVVQNHTEANSVGAFFAAITVGVEFHVALHDDQRKNH